MVKLPFGLSFDSGSGPGGDDVAPNSDSNDEDADEHAVLKLKADEEMSSESADIVESGEEFEETRWSLTLWLRPSHTSSVAKLFCLTMLCVWVPRY